mmetsp:Transcript_587/g.1732  ORF Transcript_587/g.1732 Transcript_587/m.1732 type:complete len:115 (+) Transcript_587:838-1182(+)
MDHFLHAVRRDLLPRIRRVRRERNRRIRSRLCASPRRVSRTLRALLWGESIPLSDARGFFFSVALLCPRKKATQAESPAEVIYNFMAPPPVARTLIMTMDEFDESDEVPFLPTT